MSGDDELEELEVEEEDGYGDKDPDDAVDASDEE